MNIVAQSERVRVHSGRPSLLKEVLEETVLDNLPLLATIIIVFWIGALAFYFHTSRQQKEIRRDLDALRAMLDEEEEHES